MVVQGPAAAVGTVAGPITATSPASVPDELVLTQGLPGVPEDNTAQTRGLSPASSVGPYFAPSPAPSMVRNPLTLCVLKEICIPPSGQDIDDDLLCRPFSLLAEASDKTFSLIVQIGYFITVLLNVFTLLPVSASHAHCPCPAS